MNWKFLIIIVLVIVCASNFVASLYWHFYGDYCRATFNLVCFLWLYHICSQIKKDD